MLLAKYYRAHFKMAYLATGRRRSATSKLATEALLLPTVSHTKPIWSTTQTTFDGCAASDFIYDVSKLGPCKVVALPGGAGATLGTGACTSSCLLPRAPRRGADGSGLIYSLTGTRHTATPVGDTSAQISLPVLIPLPVQETGRWPSLQRLKPGHKHIRD